MVALLLTMVVSTTNPQPASADDDSTGSPVVTLRCCTVYASVAVRLAQLGGDHSITSPATAGATESHHALLPNHVRRASVHAHDCVRVQSILSVFRI
jgi:hypothetical protein